ncbi:MAG: MBL fold metallo-hydrolase, partial [Kineosporiaceae bacterium]
VYRRGAGVAVVLLTHGHPAHAAGARRDARLAAAPVRARNPAHRLGAQGLTEGDEVTVDGFTLRVLTTPGHSSDSVCFVLPALRALITGDTVLGRGTSLVAYPDGSLIDYLRTLHRLAGVVRDSQVGLVLPGHGPVLTDPGRVLADHLAHRRDRLEQVRAARAAGATTARAVVERVYADGAPALWPAAELSVRAQLDYLEMAPEEDHPPRG